MTDDSDYYVCEYDKQGRPVPMFGPYTLNAAYTLREQLEQSEGEEVMIPPSYTVLALPNPRKKANDRT